MLKVVIGDITTANADVIVNASNGVGFMGGIIGKYIKCEGVAESIQYITKGTVEKECKRKIKNGSIISTYLKPAKLGEVIVTSGGGLSCKYIFHAVTMIYPGTWSRYKTVEKLINEIIKLSREMNIKTIAIPLLGTGVGHLDVDKVYNLYKTYFEGIDDLEIIIYTILPYGNIT